jgi:hypothetical protein
MRRTARMAVRVLSSRSADSRNFQLPSGEQQLEMPRSEAEPQNENGRLADRVARQAKGLLAKIQLLQQLVIFRQVMPF